VLNYSKLCWVICLTLPFRVSVDAAPAVVSSIASSDLIEYETQPEPIRQMIDQALSLTTRSLKYQYGSNSPDNAGMDCSGTVQFTLKSLGVEDVPRSSHTIYDWAKDKGDLTSTSGVTSIEEPVFEALKPGDLLFWEGTYDTGDRDPPISHVMIYLGRLKGDGKGVMFGASDGRHYRGKRINGVSVFDWRVPPPESSSKFVGYGPVPGLIDESDLVDEESSDSGKKGLGGLKSVLEKVFKKPETSSQ
tara:strand:- start:1235 stop:1975 length:741 start_codon:yes stop_codon:yes gene_type:complete